MLMGIAWRGTSVLGVHNSLTDITVKISSCCTERKQRTVRPTETLHLYSLNIVLSVEVGHTVVN